MTEFEVNELITGSMGLIIDLTTIFISIFAAYIVCTYIVGAKLSKLQSIAISFVYSMFSLFLVSLVYDQLIRIMAMIAVFRNLENLPIPALKYIGPTCMVIAWLLSIIYMIQVRRQIKSDVTLHGI